MAPSEGGPERIDLILVPPRELMERNELNAVAGADGGRGVAGPRRSRRSCQAHRRGAGACRQGDRMRRGLSRGACFAAGNVKKSPAEAGLFTRGLNLDAQSQTWMRGLYQMP